MTPGCALVLLVLLLLTGCSYFVIVSHMRADHCIEWAARDAPPAAVHCRDLVPSPAGSSDP